MLRLFYSLIQDHGFLGLQLTQFGVIIFCFWKLFTNHFHHMDLKIDGMVSRVSDIDSKVDNLKKEVSNDRKATNRLGNRMSKIEGKLEERDINKLSAKKKIRKRK